MTPAAYKQRRKKSLRRRKFYRRWPGDDRWLILDRAVLQDCAVLLTARGARERDVGDFGVYTDLLIANSVPSDKFAGTRQDAKSIFRSVVIRERTRERV